jgi:signal transduction histidine kinase
VAFRARYLSGLMALTAAGVTVLVSLVPTVAFAYRYRPVHVAIETAAAIIAIVTLELVRGRYRRSGLMSDLALVFAMVVLAGSNVFFATVPALTNEQSVFSAWAPLLGRVLASGAFAFSVVVPGRRVRRVAWAGTGAVVAGVLAVGVIGTVVLIFEGSFPMLGVAQSASDTTRAPTIGGPVAPLVLQALVMALYGIAAVGFVRRAERTRDELTGWFAIGLTLAAFAALNYFLYPSRHAQWVYVADILRVAWYLVLFAGAAREIAAYQARLADAAVLEERRRIARELHDGLAQELAFILGQVRGLAEPAGGSGGRFKHLVAAAERALDESRAAIVALTRRGHEPLDVTLAQAAEQVAARTGASLRLELGRDVQVEPEAHAALARIVREAVGNAARHGQAQTITVSLDNGVPGVAVSIRDDGRGFDPSAPRSGFGLTSMRERAEAVGGELRVRSEPGSGTEVEVRLP